MRELFYTAVIAGILAGVTKDLELVETAKNLEICCRITSIGVAIKIIVELFR